MLPDEVRKVVEAMDLRFTSSNEIPVERASIRDHEWSAIKAHLLAREAEVEGMRTLLDLLRTGRDGKRYACIQSRSGSMVSVEDYLAHLSENSRG